MKLERQEFVLLQGYIHELCGLAIDDQKQYLVQQRLEPLAVACKCQSFGEFHACLRGGGVPALATEVINAITTNETYFFRDEHPFATIQATIFPQLAAAVRKRFMSGGFGAKIRIWCAASSSGQEPYSLAMLIDEFVAANGQLGVSRDHFSILGTDISPKMGARFLAGSYNQFEVMRGLSPARLQRYFDREGDSWTVKASLRKMVEFRCLNLTKPFQGLGRFDFILCRNVLIYFDEAARSRVFEQFHQMLEDDGYLLLGSTENVYGLTARFESQRLGETLVYRKKGTAK